MGGEQSTPTPETNRPRSDAIEWDDYFMGVAFLSGQRSKDPRTQVSSQGRVVCMLYAKIKAIGKIYTCGRMRKNVKVFIAVQIFKFQWHVVQQKAYFCKFTYLPFFYALIFAMTETKNRKDFCVNADRCGISTSDD